MVGNNGNTNKEETPLTRWSGHRTTCASTTVALSVPWLGDIKALDLSKVIKQEGKNCHKNLGTEL